MKQVLFLAVFCLMITSAQSQSVTASPNPFPNRTLVSYTITLADSVSLQISDALGQTILIIPNSFKQPGAYQDSIIMDSFPDGVYFLRVLPKSGGQASVKLIKSGTTAIVEVKDDYRINIYPNPVKDWLTIEFKESKFKGYRLIITSALGQTVFEENCKEVRQELDLKFMPAGVYFLKVESIAGEKVLKIIKE